MEYIHAFSIAVGPAIPGFTDDQLVERDKDAQGVATALMPSLPRLLDSCVRKRWESDSGQTWRAYDLVVTPQLHLDLADGSHTPIGASALTLLHSELQRLQDESEYAAVRIGDLTYLGAILPSLDAAEAAAVINELSPADLAAWQLMHRHGGSRVSVRFAKGNASVQLPLFPIDVPEKGTRLISCRVTKPMRDVTELDEIIDHGDPENPSRYRVPSPKKLGLRRPKTSVQPQNDDWFLLYTAEYLGLTVDMHVQMALEHETLAPSHFELIEISNRELMVSKFGDLHDRIRT